MKVTQNNDYNFVRLIVGNQVELFHVSFENLRLHFDSMVPLHKIPQQRIRS